MRTARCTIKTQIKRVIAEESVATPSKKRKRDTDLAQVSLEPVKRKHKKSSSEAAPTPDDSSTDRAERKERKEKKHKDKKRRKAESSAESSEQTTPSDSVATSSRASVAPPAVSDVKAYFEKNSIAIHGTTPLDRKSTRLNSSHSGESRMPSSA